jgi:methyltransferase, putative, TIGR00027 family
MEPVSVTGQWTAAMRAEESRRTDRLFEDRYAALLAGEAGWAGLEAMREIAAPMGTVLLRTLVGDAIVRAATALGLRQVVLVAAGLDTRAYRLDLPPDLVFYEVDLPGVFAYKDPILAAAGAPPACQRVPVLADLSEPWYEALQAGGFRPNLPTVWIAEGLFFYLTEEQTRGVLSELTAVSAPGSVLIFDAIQPSFFTEPAYSRFRTYLKSRNVPWRSSIADPVTLLAGYGWRGEAYATDDLIAERLPCAPSLPPRIVDDFRHFWTVWVEYSPAGPTLRFLVLSRASTSGVARDAEQLGELVRIVGEQGTLPRPWRTRRAPGSEAHQAHRH